MVLAPGVVVGRFVVDEAVAEAGFLARMSGRDRVSNEAVVIYESPETEEPASMRHAWESEVAFASDVRSPHVEALVELVVGPPSAAVVRGPAGVPLTKLPAMPVWLAVRVIVDVLAGLEALHARAILPGALWPGGMFVLPDGTTRLGYPCCATPLPIVGAATKSVLRYLGTQSPSQLEGDPRSVEQDLHSVAVCFRELVLGRPTFDQTDLAAVLYDVCRRNTLPGLGQILWPLPSTPPPPPPPIPPPPRVPSFAGWEPFRSASHVEPETPVVRGYLLDRVLQDASCAYGPGRYLSASTFAVDLAAAVEPASHSEVAAWVREVSGV